MARGPFWPLDTSRARNRPAGEVQVSERQQRKHLCGVLDEAAIAHLAVTELALHDTEHMLDLGADFAEAAIAGALVMCQPVSGRGLLLHRPQHACCFCCALLGTAGVALIPIHRGVVAA